MSHINNVNYTAVVCYL